MTQEATVAWAPANASRRPCTTWTTCLYGRSVSAYVFLDDSLLGAHSRRQLLANRRPFPPPFASSKTPKRDGRHILTTGKVKPFLRRRADGPYPPTGQPRGSA